MFQNSRDLLVQEIQEFFQALAWVIHARSEGRPSEAYAHITELFADRLQNELRDISDLDPKEVVDLCINKGKFSPDMATAMAPLLKEKASIELEENNTSKALVSLEQAKALYMAAIDQPGETTLVDIKERVQVLDNEIRRLGDI